MNKEIYGFDEGKCQYPVFPKSNLVILKQEHTFTKSTTNSSTLNDFSVLWDFPDKTWNADNTRIIEFRKTVYNKNSDGTFTRNQTHILSDTLDGFYDETLYKYPTRIAISPVHYTSFGHEADIYFYDTMSGTKGDKCVYEVLLMKVETE